MSFARLRSPGLWAPNSVIEPEEFEQLDENLSHALDGQNGGVYTPNLPLEIGGQGICVLNPLTDDHVTPKAWVEEQIADAVSAEASARIAADATKVTAGYAVYTVNSFGDYAVDAPMALTELNVSDGFTLTSGNTVEVPSAGVYLVSISIHVSAASTNAIGARATAGGSRFLRADNNVTAGTSTGVSATAAVVITDPPNQKIQLVAGHGSGTMNVTAATQSKLSIVRISP